MVKMLLKPISTLEPLNENFEEPLDLALQAGHYQRIKEVYENLEIFLPCTDLQLQFFENSMEWTE